MSQTLQTYQLIELPVIKEPRGNLAIIEKEVIPFVMQRVYFLYDVPSGSERGGHAHKTLQQLLIATSGSFDVVLHDGKQESLVTLNRPNIGLLILPGTWREIKNFSSGSVCLVVASEVYDEEDYIRDFNLFLQYKQ
ncbi:MAG: sugar 3,4-ketoisomerase [Flavobacterium sp.]